MSFGLQGEGISSAMAVASAPSVTEPPEPTGSHLGSSEGRE